MCTIGISATYMRPGVQIEGLADMGKSVLKFKWCIVYATALFKTTDNFAFFRA